MKNIHLHCLLPLIYLSVFTGCTTTMKPHLSDSSRILSVDEKKYSIGQEKTIYVGEQVLSRKAYDVVIRSDYVRPSNAFTLTGGIGSVNVGLQGSPSDQFRIVATNDIGNSAIAIPSSHLAFGIKPDGTWDGTIASGSFWTAPVGSGSAYKMNPRDTKFEKVESRTPIPENGYVNHELIFTGISGDGIHLLYREYTFENMARSAFSQDLHYTKDAGTVRFRNYQLKLISTTSSSLTLVVLSD